MNALHAAQMAIAAMDNPQISRENYEDARDRALVYGVLAMADPNAEVDLPEWIEERAEKG